jgi:hypothetical protein
MLSSGLIRNIGNSNLHDADVLGLGTYAILEDGNSTGILTSIVICGVVSDNLMS